ncbi:MAG TPA: FAD-dependent thymidylate synthase, partial [Chloroflexota bacterium]
MKIVTEPEVYVVGRQTVNAAEVQRFLDEHDTSWNTETEKGAEFLTEMAGRVCYMSFGSKQGRRSNSEYMSNIIDSGHGSVLEHGVWNFIIAGVSRTFTHELIRHRAGWGYS